jgi:putative transposase
LSKIFWGQHLWDRGYFVATTGTITDKVIMAYIKNQDDSVEQQEDFTIG